MSDDLKQLELFFTRFPGVGPRQAKRFVYHLLRISKSDRNRFQELVRQLDTNTATCDFCGRLFTRESAQNGLCRICVDKNRDQTTLLIVEKENDMENIERQDSYVGRYFIFGPMLSPFDERGREKIVRLEKLLSANPTITEAIFALAANPDGDFTTTQLKKHLTEKLSHLKLTMLGRGLSTGAELEYLDHDTLKNALENRK